MDAVEAQSSQADTGYPQAMAAFGESVSALRDSADLARLTDDPAAPSLEALVRVMTTVERQFQAREGERKLVVAALDARAKRIAEDATKRIEASGATIVAGLAPELAKLVDRSVRLRVWNVRTGTLAAVGGVAVALAVACFAVGYGLAYKAGRNDGLLAGKTIAAAMSAGPEAAVAWAQLMAANDPVQGLKACRAAIEHDHDRRSCLMPVWLDPPLPPTPVRPAAPR